MDLTEKAILCVLHSANGVGNRSLWKIKDEFGTFQACYEANNSRLCSSFLPGEAVENIISKKNIDPESYLHKVMADGINILTWEDEDYPSLLRQIVNPPYVLYYRGQIEYSEYPAIAVVGSRVASHYGKNTARKFGSELAARGITVVSGMARGIDSEAHRGALETGKTIAVLGCGLNIVYPPENEKLYSEIVSAGAVISEFPPNTGPEPGNFPMRNRIISGLCRGVVVIEAKQKSGALITTDFALEQGRDVFAVPGPINSKTSEGTNNLIKQGAKLVTCCQDIIEEYSDLAAAELGLPQQASLSFLTGDETKLLDAFNNEPCHFDDLLQITGFDFGQLSTILLELEFRGIIRGLPGNYYIKQQR